jgi:hypothetical protein
VRSPRALEQVIAHAQRVDGAALPEQFACVRAVARKGRLRTWWMSGLCSSIATMTLAVL